MSLATFGPVDCLSTRLFLDGPKIAEEFEVLVFSNFWNFIYWWECVHDVVELILSKTKQIISNFTISVGLKTIIYSLQIVCLLW